MLLLIIAAFKDVKFAQIQMIVSLAILLIYLIHKILNVFQNVQQINIKPLIILILIKHNAINVIRIV